MKRLLINGHFRSQRLTGVQRYAHEVIAQFDQKKIPYEWAQPPRNLQADALRQLWMQSVMPFKIPDNSVLWSPTNIGPVWNKNQVLTLHDIADQLYPAWFDEKYVAWRRFILPKLLARVRGIITVSEFSKRSILERFPQTKGKIKVIYNGVRVDHFFPRNEEEKNQVRKTFNLQKPFVLCVGSLDPRKNIQGLLKAWHLLPEPLREEMNLVITGESARKFAFTMEENYDESVHFTGYVKEKQLPILYSGAQLFVYPSLFEGFGLPVLEAMACGTPVITSNTTALKEVAGDAALLVNPQSAEEIKAAIFKLAESEALRSQMQAKGKEWSAHFKWDRCAEKTYTYLKDFCAK